MRVFNWSVTFSLFVLGTACQPEMSIRRETTPGYRGDTVGGTQGNMESPGETPEGTSTRTESPVTQPQTPTPVVALAPTTPVYTSEPTANSGSITLNWSHDMKNVGSFLVLRSENEITINPTDGLDYSVGDSIGGAVVIYDNLNLSYEDKTAANYLGYKYKIYSRSNKNLYSSSISLEANSRMDGLLDESFGTNGVLVIDSLLGGDNERVMGIVSLEDNSILIAGDAERSNGRSDAFVVKLRENGTIDESFGNNGVWNHFASTNEDDAHEVSEMLIDSSGRIILAGRQDTSNDSMVIWRLNSNGTLDTSFNGVGYSKHSGASEGYVSAKGNGIVIDAANNILVCGVVNDGSDEDLAIWRFLEDGSLDTNYSSNGIAALHISNRFETAFDCKYNQEDGGVLLTGMTGSGRGFVAKINSSGIFDTNFNSAGFHSNLDPESGNFGILYSLEILADGSIISTGLYRNSSNDWPMITAKLDKFGQIDSSYANNGFYEDTSIDATGADIVRRRDGGIVVIGSTTNGSDYDVSLWSFDPTGQLDNFMSLGSAQAIHQDSAGGTNVDEYGRTAAFDYFGNRLYVAGNGVNGAGDGDIVVWKYK